jgi:DNA-binding MarR family transcriptional regulator
MKTAAVEDSVGYLIKRVQQNLRRTCDAALKPNRLSMAQYAALRALADHPNASAADLARLCFVTRQSLQDLLIGLRSAGLVESADESARGRAKSLRLTPGGRRQLAQGHAAVLAAEAAMLEGIPQRDLRLLAALLTQCAANLEERSSDS